MDSTVCAALLHKALDKDQVLVIHIDNGFMRKNETEHVEESLSQLGIKIKVINATHKFAHGTTTLPVEPPPNAKTGSGTPVGGTKTKMTKMLCATINPEEKRKIIGDVFVHVASEAIAEFGLKPEEVILGQGTLRPDLIESASSLVSGNYLFHFYFQVISVVNLVFKILFGIFFFQAKQTLSRHIITTVV